MKNLTKFIIASLGVILVGCGTKGTEQSKNASLGGDSTRIQHVVYKYSDSLQNVNNGGYAYMTTKIDVDFPQSDNKVLMDTLLRFINKQMGGNAPKSMLKDNSKLVDFYGNASKTSMKDDVKKKGGIVSGMENNVRISRLYETPLLITYGSTSYKYLDGEAHGSTICKNITFVKKDGKQMGWSMFNEKIKNKTSKEYNQLVSLIIKGLKDYFKVDSDSKLADMLIIEGTNTSGNQSKAEILKSLPLPNSAPYIMKDGVHFLYGQVEISSYSAGMPNAVVKYKDILPLLTKEARELLDL